MIELVLGVMVYRGGGIQDQGDYPQNEPFFLRKKKGQLEGCETQ